MAASICLIICIHFQAFPTKERTKVWDTILFPHPRHTCTWDVIILMHRHADVGRMRRHPQSTQAHVDACIKMAVHDEQVWSGMPRNELSYTAASRVLRLPD